MTSTSFDNTVLRQWLVDYLITNIGCDPNDVNPDSSFSDLGVGSRDAVVLSGELAELLGRPVSPVEFWEHPTINALARVSHGTRIGNRGREALSVRPRSGRMGRSLSSAWDAGSRAG